MLILFTAPAVYCGEAREFQGEIVNAVDLEPGIVGGGLLSNKAVETAAGKGFKTIIDLRTPPEGTQIERRLAETAGLRYINIPTSIGGRKQAEELKAILSKPEVRPAIVHCRSGSRVRQVWAAYQSLNREKNEN